MRFSTCLTRHVGIIILLLLSCILLSYLTWRGSQHDIHSLEDLQDPNSAFITIKVVYWEGKEPKETYCKVGRSAELGKFQNAFANRVGKNVGCIRFLHNGKRIYNDGTPAELDMKDGDTIDVCNEQPLCSPCRNAQIQQDRLG
ncbi:hypothetical protein BD779DRAFT_1145878 [Infundibulicybe gibba]|nr:hypothetical protein BD779DRAFT_1145878 [Infundibulicybe gibba]